MKKFCISGPIQTDINYYIPKRLNWNQLDTLIEDRQYFILHAPRQSGKTTAILEYVKDINNIRKFKAVYLSTEPAHTAKNDIETTIYLILSQFLSQIQINLPEETQAINFLKDQLAKKPIEETALFSFLKFWAEVNSKPLVIFFDEFDGLVEKSLIFMLKQLRTGYTNRPKHFPQSVCLIGVRNLQDYKLRSQEEQEKGILISPFNIVTESLVLKNFTRDQVQELYEQHTQDTGQTFTKEAIDYAHYLTHGQPWLVNALAYQACYRDVTDRNQPITKEIIERSKEQLILRRDTHLNALIDRLSEPRVRNIVDAIISGTDPISLNPDDIQYVRDLGLVKTDSWEIANPIYQQVIPRALTFVLQELIPQKIDWYLDKSGKIDINKLICSFTEFYRENSESYEPKFDYKESFPHLILMAFLQRIINGGGQIIREYAVGRKRIDLLIIWQKYKYLIELKIRRGEETLTKGLEQTANYMDYTNANEAHLIIFDRDPNKTWEEKISNEKVTFNSKEIHVWTL